MILPLLVSEYYGIAADLIISGAAALALRQLWKAYRADKTQCEQERAEYAKRIGELTDALDKVQSLRVKEILDLEDKQHQVLQQYSTKMQDLATAISQLQYIVMLTLHMDPTKTPPHIGDDNATV